MNYLETVIPSPFVTGLRIEPTPESRAMVERMLETIYAESRVSPKRRPSKRIGD